MLLDLNVGGRPFTLMHILLRNNIAEEEEK